MKSNQRREITQSDLRIVDRLLLGFGALMISAGIIFFFAYNWRDFHRYGKFALVEILLVISLYLSYRWGVNKKEGLASLSASCLLTGALLALYGQTYQTGADPFQLFLTWAVLILPWVIISRSSLLWGFWLLLINTGAVLFTNLHFDFEIICATLGIINIMALAFSEWKAKDPIMRRIVATVILFWGTSFIVTAIFDNLYIALIPSAIFMYGSVYFFYRRVRTEIYILSLAILSFILTVSSYLSEIVFDNNGELGLLGIAILIIVLSSGGGLWLKKISK